jgi:hypothetical protein
MSGMASPFPGMDPYLEMRWRDVHTSLVAGARAMLNEALPAGLIARAEERIAIESDEVDQQYSPDVSVLHALGKEPAVPAEGAGRWAAAPFRLVALVEPFTERFIEISESSGEKLITVIEFVSPSNKRGEGLRAFVKKRNTLLAGGVSFVEVDLTRWGDWRELLSPHRCPREAVTPYRAIVRIPGETRTVYLYPIDLRKSVEPLPIPLRENDPPVDLPLQQLIEQAYRTGRYDQTIDYTAPLVPSLGDADAAWADELLRAAGKR